MTRIKLVVFCYSLTVCSHKQFDITSSLQPQMTTKQSSVLRLMMNIINFTALDYETRKVYTFKVEASNAALDHRFLHLGPFKDTATVKVNVLDVEEPPVFSRLSYRMETYEDTPVGIMSEPSQLRT